MDVFTLEIRPEDKEMQPILLMENRMTDSLENIIGQMKNICVDQDPKYKNYDLTLDFGSGHHYYENELQGQKLSDFGITRFSHLKYRFKTIDIHFQNGSVSQISLKGKQSLSQTEFKSHMREVYPSLPEYFSLEDANGKFIEQARNITHGIKTIAVTDLKCDE